MMGLDKNREVKDWDAGIKDVAEADVRTEEMEMAREQRMGRG